MVVRGLAYLAKLCEAVDNLSCGMPWVPGVSITPLPVPGKPEHLAELVREAEGLGARKLNQNGGAINRTFYSPAVVSGVDSRMKLYHEEQFGPVVPVALYDDIDEPVNYIIESPYGQQASIFGTDSGEIARLIDPLVNQLCRVNINSQCQRGPDVFPFTGRQDSAEGTFSVSDALRVFSIRTLVAAKDMEINKRLLTEILRERKSNFLSTDYLF